MTCRDIEPLLLTERDGTLTSGQRAALEQHVAACPACQQLRVRLNAALDAFQADAAKVTIPDADTEWRTLRAQLHGEQTKPAKKRPLAPVIWFGSSLAAAAALVLIFFTQSPQPDSPTQTARTGAADVNASTIAYVDKESGWLVVWATEGDAKSSG